MIKPESIIPEFVPQIPTDLIKQVGELNALNMHLLNMSSIQGQQNDWLCRRMVDLSTKMEAVEHGLTTERTDYQLKKAEHDDLFEELNRRVTNVEVWHAFWTSKWTVGIGLIWSAILLLLPPVFNHWVDGWKH